MVGITTNRIKAFTTCMRSLADECGIQLSHFTPVPKDGEKSITYTFRLLGGDEVQVRAFPNEPSEVLRIRTELTQRMRKSK